MLTIFTIPKPFHGHIATIQRNAALSWKYSNLQPQIILLGDEVGVADFAREQNLAHIPKIARNEFGTPLMSDAFVQARTLASHDILIYINADIILLPNFVEAVIKASQRFDRFLAVSKRINIDISSPIDFHASWESDLRKNIADHGKFAPDSCIDLFAFPKSSFERIPDFAIGRLWFDHWFIRAARKEGLPVVELSPFSPLIHQNHDYSHVTGGLDAIWVSKETQQNLKLYGKVLHDYTLADATHQLLPEGKFAELQPYKRSQPLRYFIWEILVQNTFPARQRLGLRRESFRALITRWRS
jgi:hypothetical protein